MAKKSPNEKLSTGITALAKLKEDGKVDAVAKVERESKRKVQRRFELSEGMRLLRVRYHSLYSVIDMVHIIMFHLSC